MNEKITEISLKKNRILYILLFLLAILGLGIVFVFFPSLFVSSLFRSAELIRVCGILCCLTIFLVVPYLFMMTSSKPGLVLSSEGIINRSNWTDLGLVLWRDVTGIERKKIGKVVYFFVKLKNLDDYISKVKNPLKRINLLQYKATYNTPVVINPRTLACSIEDLEENLMKYFKKE